MGPELWKSWLGEADPVDTSGSLLTLWSSYSKHQTHSEWENSKQKPVHLSAGGSLMPFSEQRKQNYEVTAYSKRRMPDYFINPQIRLQRTVHNHKETQIKETNVLSFGALSVKVYSPLYLDAL